MKMMIVASAALLPLTAIHAEAQTSPSTYVMKAGASDQYELQSSQLLLESTQNPKLREFAQMMIQDHTKSTADVTAAAQQAGLTPKPPMLDAKGKADVAALRRANGTARDRLYVTQQKAAHKKAYALHSGYASKGTSAPLKAVAAQVAPVVQHHITELQSM